MGSGAGREDTEGEHNDIRHWSVENRTALPAIQSRYSKGQTTRRSPLPRTRRAHPREMGTGTVDSGTWRGDATGIIYELDHPNNGGDTDTQTQTVFGHTHQGTLLSSRDTALAGDRDHTSRIRQEKNYGATDTGASNTNPSERVEPGGQTGSWGD